MDSDIAPRVRSGKRSQANTEPPWNAVRTEAQDTLSDNQASAPPRMSAQMAAAGRSRSLHQPTDTSPGMVSDALRRTDSRSCTTVREA